MSSILDKIIVQKKREVAQLYQKLAADAEHALHTTTITQHAPRFFQKALRTQGKPAVLAEIKRRSPSRGEIAEIRAPESLALAYAQGGAAAISVLTDNPSFGGSLEDLRTVKRALAQTPYSVPILRKDFIIDPLQLLESAQAGAQAVLLIVSVLQKSLAEFLRESERLGLEALVEVHSREELELALDAGASIIGVNQRNLQSFAMVPEIFEDLAPYFPSHITRVAESGIFTREQSQKVAALGYHAILVGEALVRSPEPMQLIQELKGRL